ncbi:alpha-D-mannose-specific plant lectins domain-containing protein [Dioscorea alata]|uniref:Alpha-D-mannose-specific plant lectins domain-containing protein n=1 Tax=Dioscorea alata TaxID=55571 RepID=A0ACB7U9P9_DIOAL|nr:alpha-D-mannose-specific plant lectins domain-containing protein [Dioscorea alata]
MAIPRAFASLSLALLLVASPLSCMADFILYSGESLCSEQALNHMSYTFIMQSDCNLVLYDGGSPVWASDTGGLGQRCCATLQRDGNLVIKKNNYKNYNDNYNVVWASNTNVGEGYYVLILQKDRNVVIYGGAIWATDTHVGVSRAIVINSKATIFGALPANNTTTGEAKVAGISTVVNN